jgi:hypothetical protein
MEADEADDVANGGLGTQSLAGGSIHSAGCPSTFAASWPPVTNKFRDSLVAVERGHAGGSMTVMDGGGAMRMGEGARNAKRKWRDGERASAALERKRKGRRWRTLSVKVKIRFASPIGFIAPQAMLSGAHAPHALTAGKNFSR